MKSDLKHIIGVSLIIVVLLIILLMLLAKVLHMVVLFIGQVQL